MSSFFTVPKAQKKRKRVTIAEPPKKRIATSAKSSGKAPASTATPRQSRKLSQKQASREDNDDDSISGSDDDSDLDRTNGLNDDLSDSNSDHEGETAAEKRLRLAERYLENTRQEVIDDYGFDAAEIDKEILAARLQEDVAESKGKVYKRLASQLAFDKAAHTLFRSNTQAVTAVATHAPFAYTVTKDMMLIKWRIRDLPQLQFPKKTKKQPRKPPTNPHKRPERVRMYRGNRNKVNDKAYMGHTGAILAVACSSDGKYVVTAGADKKIIVYDTETLKPLRVFNNQHRAAVTGLAFRRGTNQMYSCSRDRVVKVWSLDELAYVSSLFGHEEAVVDIDALGQERCVTVGSRDRTARFWKVVDEKQLVFRGGVRDRKPVPGIDPKSQAQEGSIDRVAMIDDELFVTGGDSGSLTLWSIQKKNPLFVIPRAHGIDNPLAPEVVSAESLPDPKKVVPPPQPRWITALKTVPFSDVVLSGSWDGHVRIWKLSEDKKRLEAVGILGGPLEMSQTPNGVHENGVSDAESTEFEGLSDKEKDSDDSKTLKQEDKQSKIEEPWKIKGVINDLSVFERGNRGKDGLCVVAAVGNEHKFGRWMGKIQGARNGGVVFEIPRIPLTRKGYVNGVAGGEDEEE